MTKPLPLARPLTYAAICTALGLGLSTSRSAEAAPPSINPSEPAQLSGDEGLNSCKQWKKGQRYTITIPPEAELEQLVKWMSTISCQKFIWNSKIRSGKVTVLSPESITLREAYAAFYAALESMGLTVEPTADYFKIVEIANAKALNLPIYDEYTAPNNDRYVTQLVRLDAADATEVAAVLDKMKSKQGSIEVVGDLMIITERGSTVRRFQKIIKQLDRAEAGDRIFFYQLQFADANEVADIIREIFGEKSGGASSKSKSSKKSSRRSTSAAVDVSRVIVDDRTGTLIIVASPTDYSTVRRLVEQLDVRLPGGGGRIHVKPLKYADPKELATVLQSLTQTKSSSSKKKGKNKSAAEGGVSAELFSGDVKVTADEASRSLVIVASAADYRNLERVIDEIDMDRPQVYLEIYLLEANVTRGLTAGTGGHFGAPIPTANGDGLGFVTSTPSPEVSSLALNPAGLQGLAGGLLGPQIPNSGQLLGTQNDVPGFGLVIQALHQSDDINVVAEPHVMTADNREVELEVGQTVPTPNGVGSTSGITSAGGLSAIPQVNVQREPVTLKIKVTPHVNDTETVTMDVEIEDQDVVSIDPILGVTTTKRKFKLEHIKAQNEQPLVLGGLIREKESDSSEEVPGLGKIPIFGWLFKRKKKGKEKVNLLVIMVPHIVDSPDDVRRIHARRIRERMEFLERESSFARKDLETNINYRDKSGLLPSIDREARRLEHEERLLRQAEEELSAERISGELGASPRLGNAASTESKPAARPTAKSTPSTARIR